MNPLRKWPRPLPALAAVTLIVAALAVVARYLPARLLAVTSDPSYPLASSDTLGDFPADAWLNGAGPITGADLRGSPVLVEFWTYLCYNCKNVEPWMKRTHARYAPQGLAVIGVHTPEFSQEREIDNVKHYLEKNGITWPVAIDNGFRVWRRYNSTNAWPAFLVYNRSGELVYRAAGENAVTGAEAAIRRVLEEKTNQQPAASSGTSDGIRVRAMRRTDSVAITLTPLPGFKLVESPPNEIWLDGAGEFVPIGKPFTGAEAAEVNYYAGPASVTVPLRGRAPQGRVRYRVCDERTGVCLQREVAFRAQ
ncbi:MAG: redoxin domain-containing protein [Gemmatimonadota bacterium]